MSNIHTHYVGTVSHEVSFGFYSGEWTPLFVVLMVLCCWFTASVFLTMHNRRGCPLFPKMEPQCSEDSAAQNNRHLRTTHPA